MTNVKERVAYLHGLTKGLNVSDKTPEGKAILNMIDVLEDLADDIKTMHVQQRELETYVETIDEDLNDLEEDFYEDVAEYEDGDFVEMKCPTCHEAISFEAELMHDADDIEVVCPHCSSVVYDNFSENGPRYDHTHSFIEAPHDAQARM